MEFKEYQRLTATTAGPDGLSEERSVLGVCGEAGEVSEARKKFLRGDYDHTEYIRRLTKELGDELWYISECCSAHGLEMEDVAKQNIEKLKNRKKNNTIKGDGDNR